MASQMKTPGVYIKEINAFPNSVVEVATAVPAFVGYTEKAEAKGKSLRNAPYRITSMAEFGDCFGGEQKSTFHVTKADANSASSHAIVVGAERWNVTPVARQEQLFLLFRSMQLFFQNGGSDCYVVSVGSYQDAVTADSLIAGIATLTKEQEPTMLVVPDAVHLATVDDCTRVQKEQLRHCGDVMRSRFAILDIYDGDRTCDASEGDPVQQFRDAVGEDFLKFGAAYYPWLNTTIVQMTDVSGAQVDPQDLSALLAAEAALSGTASLASAAQLAAMATGNEARAYTTLLQSSRAYSMLMVEMQRQLNLLPPAAAMAGVYTMVDNSRGVWKAPANVSLNSVVSPAVAITNEGQEDLNVPMNGKAINAIRTFIGEGTLVWGARTLDGNSQDWRYINVRRTVIMLEESLKQATKAYVFEPNAANTWVTLKSMMTNFLTGVWKRGGLAGATPGDAFSVHCGLGETMTPDDILEGILRVTILIAVSHPAEFLEISFQQQMQKS